MSEMIFELEEKKNALLKGVQALMKLAATLAKVRSHFMIKISIKLIICNSNYKYLLSRFIMTIGIRHG